MGTIVTAVAVVLALAAGLGIGKTLARGAGRQRMAEAEELIRRREEETRERMATLEKELELKGKAKQLELRQQFDNEAQASREKIRNQELRNKQKNDVLEKKSEVLDRRDLEITQRERTVIVREKALVQQEKKYQALVDDWYTKIEKAAGLTSQEAKKQLVESVISEAKHEAAKSVRRIEEEARESAEKNAKKIIALATQRVAVDFVNENSVSVVHLPNEEMKGRIIGREGRNIRALEAATGIDFIVDDTPEAVILSGHNPVRRAVASRVLQQLIQDGRIHPGRIEEIVQKVEQEIEKEMAQAGEQATFDVGVHGMHPDLIKLLGRLRYRTSYSQNQLSHAVEVAFINGIMAAELGLNVKIARRAGLLHDIGKAVDHEVEGSHALIGMELARKYNEHPDVCHAIGAHHEDIKMESALDVITQVADALSGARPGARREMFESYIKRLNDLEGIAQSFEGVEKTFAIQAGREIRVMVEAEKVDDDGSLVLSKDIARKIEQEMTYPGQIRVVVIRESRAVEYAR
ncbi:MAG: ribonuclease Y [Deltaproteobacteria bacterium]|nr:ribonuclease Y [Deltaproteobacteria bacterium]